MPLYEYQCEACGVRFERIRKFSDPPLEVCPTCGSGPVQKLVSSPAFQFKGSGWYITDYARKSGSEGGSTTGSGESKSKPAASSDSSSTSSTSSSSSSSSTESSSKESTTTKGS